MLRLMLPLLLGLLAGLAFPETAFADCGPHDWSPAHCVETAAWVNGVAASSLGALLVILSLLLGLAPVRAPPVVVPGAEEAAEAPVAPPEEAPPAEPPPPTVHRQELNDSCGVSTTRMMIERLTGADPGEAPLREPGSEFRNNDWNYGMTSDNVEGMLDANGVDGRHLRDDLGRDPTIADLQQAIADGRQVAVLHRNDPTNPNAGNHWQVVRSMTQNPDGTYSVTLDDPLTGTSHVESGDWLNARWHPGNTMVAE